MLSDLAPAPSKSIHLINTLIFSVYLLVVSLSLYLFSPGAKTIKKNTNSTQNKSQTHHAKLYEVTSFLSTDCELSTETCSKNVYSLGPWGATSFLVWMSATVLVFPIHFHLFLLFASGEMGCMPSHQQNSSDMHARMSDVQQYVYSELYSW